MTANKAQEVLNAFYNDRVPESLIADRLVEAGKPIVPFLLAEILKKDMRRRGYAIGALGEIKDKRAIPVLVQILGDQSEIYYFRSDALRAIWHIDRTLGEEYAKQFAGKIDGINRIIQLLRDGQI